MKFIIHHNTDLTPQIETCRQVLEATAPCSPDCEVCAHMDKLAEAGKGLKAIWESRYKEEYDKMTKVPVTEPEPKLTADLLEKVHDKLYIGSLEAQIKELGEWKKSALDLLNGIDIQKVGELMHLTIGDAVLPNIQPYIELLQGIREAQALRIEAMQKVVDAAISLAKEANYLHPFSLEVGEKVDNLQRAVQTWLKPVDANAPKS